MNFNTCVWGHHSVTKKIIQNCQPVQVCKCDGLCVRIDSIFVLYNGILSNHHRRNKPVVRPALPPLGCDTLDWAVIFVDDKMFPRHMTGTICVAFAQFCELRCWQLRFKLQLNKTQALHSEYKIEIAENKTPERVKQPKCAAMIGDAMGKNMT